MENMRTVAFQVPESLFQRIKEYLQRNNMTQRQFLLGLIEAELDRDLTEREAAVEAVSDDQEQEDKVPSEDEETACEGEADEEFAQESDDQSEAEPTYGGFNPNRNPPWEILREMPKTPARSALPAVVSMRWVQPQPTSFSPASLSTQST